MKRFTSSAIYLTRSCNLSCEYCLVPKIPTKDADRKDILKALNVMEKNSEFIILFGGEPTISPNLDEVIAKLVADKTEFTLISNGVKLKDENYCRHLRDIGLKSITVSHDSYKSYSLKLLPTLKKLFSDVSVNIIYDRQMVGKLYPLIQQLTNQGIWSIVTAYVFFNDEREHWYFPPPVQQFQVTRGQGPTVAHEMEIIYDNYGNLKIHNSRAYFNDMIDHIFLMDWHCDRWKVLFVNNDLRIQFCQDLPASTYTVFDLDKKYDEMKTAWRQAVLNCKGCYINCFFDAEHIEPSKVRHEIITNELKNKPYKDESFVMGGGKFKPDYSGDDY